jgi:hypothetical protein
VRLSLSPTYWPFAWPSPEPVTLEVALGDGTFVTLPEREPGAVNGPVPSFAAPERAESAAGETTTIEERMLVRHAATGEIRSTVVNDERSHLATTDLWFGERQENTHVLFDDPLAARLEYRAEHHLKRGDWKIRVVVNTSVTADADSFTVTTERDAYEGQVRVHALRRSTRIPRNGN